MMTFTHEPQTVEGMIKTLNENDIDIEFNSQGVVILWTWENLSNFIEKETIQEAYAEALSRGWLNYPEAE